MIHPRSLCVIVLKTDVLSKRAVISLLNLEKELEIVISEANDIEELAMDVSKIKPDAVLFTESHPIAKNGSLAQLLFSNPKVKVVVASVNSNWLYVFDKEDKLITSLDDLLSVIKVD